MHAYAAETIWVALVHLIVIRLGEERLWILQPRFAQLQLLSSEEVDFSVFG